MTDNLPISIIMGDVNGLKLTNDVFGHGVGDMLLQKVAAVFRRVGVPVMLSPAGRMNSSCSCRTPMPAKPVI